MEELNEEDVDLKMAWRGFTKEEDVLHHDAEQRALPPFLPNTTAQKIREADLG